MAAIQRRRVGQGSEGQERPSVDGVQGSAEGSPRGMNRRYGSLAQGWLDAGRRHSMGDATGARSAAAPLPSGRGMTPHILHSALDGFARTFCRLREKPARLTGGLSLKLKVW